MEQVLGGLQILLTWQNFLVIPVGLIIGIVVVALIACFNTFRKDTAKA